MDLSATVFKKEINKAKQAYDKYIVCLEKTPDEFEDSMMRLLDKAIKAFQDRETGLRHGIALDRHVTIIISQTEGNRPLCGIYFNLHSPYALRKKRSN